MGIFDRFPYSSTHEMNLDFMLGKATEIAEDMQTVATGMSQVQAGLSAISEKTEQATQAAAQAAQSASSIEGSVTAAEEAAEEAQMHNESAQTWANNAMTYKADCQRSATEAAASSSSAAQAATAAAASEDTVAQYAQAANASAQSAANNNDSAHQYANQASASASNATLHSSNAQTAATNAQTAATNANTSATNASASADMAASLKTDVETLHRMCVAAADEAATQAVNSANSAAQAAASKTDVENLVESLPEDFTDLNNNVNQLSDEIDNVEESIGYEILPIAPTEYLPLPETGKGLNYLGNLVDDSSQDATDYIELDGLYDIFRIVSTENKWSLGLLCYYTESKQFIRRDVLGNTYTFSNYNGERGVWLGVDKTVPNAKYVRYSGDNARGFKYWKVMYGPTAAEFSKYSKMPLLGKKVVNFGDSIFGLTRPPKDISSYLATITGATVYNAGFGGCEMSNHADSNYNPFSMCNLATAISSGVWTTQENAASASGMPAYFAETVTMLKSLDFSTVDIITIAYGTNDWMNSTPLDNGTDSNLAYFADALRYSIKTILEAYPNIRIFVCTPIYRFWNNSQGEFENDSNTRINTTTNTKLTDFVQKTIEVSAEYQIPCIDNYQIGINRYNRLQYFYSYDGSHPMPSGNKLIANHIAHDLY